MTRDKRLLIGLAFFSVSLVASLIEAWIIAFYIESSIAGDWTVFAETFGVQAPARGPDVFCFGRCAPDLPFVAGWVAIVAFMIGWAIVARAWWRPKG